MKGEVANIPVIGAAGTGKTPWTQAQVRKAKPKRLLVWDPMSQWASFGTVFTSRQSLLQYVLRENGVAARPFAAVFQPGDMMSVYPAWFDWFCTLAYRLTRLTLVVEELAHVTTPQKAPDGWKACTTLSGHRHLRVYGTSQFPAAIDKAFLSNATLIHCGRVFEKNANDTMRDLLGVSRDELAALQDGTWYERDMRRGTPAVLGHYKARDNVT